MQVNNVPGCCGIREIHALGGHQTAEDATSSFAAAIYPEKHPYLARFRYAIFSQANYRGAARVYTYGKDFAAYIRENKLGTLVKTSANSNPNTGSQVIVWIWTVDHDAVKAWWVSRSKTASGKSHIKLQAERLARMNAAPAPPAVAGQPMPPVAAVAGGAVNG